MKKKYLLLLPMLILATAGTANANWQGNRYKIAGSSYEDDGGRFVVSVRGGASLGWGSVKNKIGPLTSVYYVNPETQGIIPEIVWSNCVKNGQCGTDDFVSAGVVDLGTLSPNKDYNALATAAGASVGWALPGASQWRLELGWDHISESDYNATPFAKGTAELYTGNDDTFALYQIESGAVQSTVSSDIISVMAFYDFFDGAVKPVKQVIPYVGFGIGYADIKTVLNLSDPYGDLSDVYELISFGEQDASGVIQFYRSEDNSSSIAGLLAVGVSYGLSKYMYLDFGARLMYIPEIKWQLANQDATRKREWFNAENTIYANIMLGLRFEF